MTLNHNIGAENPEAIAAHRYALPVVREIWPIKATEPTLHERQRALVQASLLRCPRRDTSARRKRA
jgi:hypothetical protein